ncbi:hypothetical protein CYY_006980 [Polysphondylium violaceum]|uniref:Aminopeptidase n=1 Tax=Polysphondylium violaceum TaxID=133409 RepID=A0A8J4V5A1_9MYCE|nr:hypothetical protein CYY_006980 [Polysphondylium violaceum]
MCDHKHLIDKNDRLVLPDNVVPSVYDLHIMVDYKSFTFKGEEDITVEVKKPTKVVVIHCLEIVIHSAKLGDQTACKIEYHAPEEVAILTFEQEAQVCESTKLSLTFDGIINDQNLQGFYRSKYVVDGQDRYVCLSQFEATHARRAFPCFDEPALKAKFNLTFTVPTHLTALSNTEEVSIKENTNDNTKTILFQTTPIMSTYLLAYIVGEFTYVEGSTNNIRVRAYKLLGQLESAEFALDVAIKALSIFIDYFGIPFPLTKCDHVAVPDFSYGAMENWGLITYRESLFLVSEKVSLLIKQKIAIVIGHELAHQWFGNLVTMEWWSQLWLNEGFATFMGSFVTDKIYPEWDCWLEFSDHYRAGALNLDALENTHPIEVPVRSSAEINEVFDAISYNKGSCVIQMIEGRLGDNFRKGLNHYLNKHSYKNTNTEDLWESLSLLSGIDIKTFIDPFTKYSGYPVIDFKTTQTPGTFQLTQKKFRLDGSAQQPTDPIWNNYIKIETASGSSEFILDKKSDTLTVPNFKQGDWIKPNFGQTGYYRINYDPAVLATLIPRIKSLELPSVDRLNLISDMYSICKSGDVTIDSYMDLIVSYSNETEYFIWNSICDNLSFIASLIQDQTYYTKFCQIVINLLKPISKKLGFDPIKGERSSDTLLRDKIQMTIGEFGDQEVIQECKKRFELFKNDPANLPADIRLAVLSVVVAHGGINEQQVLFDMYHKTISSSEKSCFIIAMAKSPKPEAICKILDFSLGPDVRSQDTYMAWIFTQTPFKPVVWQFLIKNFKALETKFPETRSIGRIISGSFQPKMDEAGVVEIEKFFIEHPVPSAERVIKQDIEKIRINTKWANSFIPTLGKWVEKNSSNNSYC